MRVYINTYVLPDRISIINHKIFTGVKNISNKLSIEK